MNKELPDNKIIEKSIFKFEVVNSLSTTLAYKFYCDNVEVTHNNNYYPSKKALKNDEVMFKELAKIMLNEKSIEYIYPDEKKFLESKNFEKLKKIFEEL